MKALHELKSTLCDTLQAYAGKTNLSVSDVDVIDKLTHTIKNLDKILDKEEGNSYNDRSYRDNSYGSAYRRDSMGRYSGDDMMNRYTEPRGYLSDGNSQRSYSRYSRHGESDLVSKLEDMMQDAPDDKTRMAIEKCIGQIER